VEGGGERVGATWWMMMRRKNEGDEGELPALLVSPFER